MAAAGAARLASRLGLRPACGGGDGEICLWDLATAGVLRRCEGHEGPVMTLAFSSDDRTLVSKGNDMAVLVWDLSGMRDASRKQPEEKR